MAGSIEKRGKNKYRLTVSTGSGKSRKRYRRTVEYKNKTQASKELAKFVAEIEGDNFIELSKVTFEAFTQKWLENYARPNLAPKTVYEYERLLDLRILPAFSPMQLNKIKPVHIMEFYNILQEGDTRKDGQNGKLSNSTIMHYQRKGLKKITFHQLRHTSATMLINAGLNIRALSARLGHSNTSTTLNIYSHALQSADEVAAEKMEKIMFGDGKK